MRHCARRFMFLLDGGVKVTWDCGSEKVLKGETAVDVEILADRTADLGHHHKHRHHREA